jgi:hypothetical protein
MIFDRSIEVSISLRPLVLVQEQETYRGIVVAPDTSTVGEYWCRPYPLAEGFISSHDGHGSRTGRSACAKGVGDPEEGHGCDQE